MFSLGTLFYAILERDSIVIDGRAIYGAFVKIPVVGKVGLGCAMAKFGPRHSIIFASPPKAATPAKVASPPPDGFNGLVAFSANSKL